MPTIAPAAAAASSPTFFEDLLSDSRTPLLVDFYATWYAQSITLTQCPGILGKPL